MITIKLPYSNIDEEFTKSLLEHQRVQSNITRFSFNRYQDNLKDNVIREQLRHIDNLKTDSWVLQCGIIEAKSLYKKFKDKKIIFGGRNNLLDYLKGLKPKHEFKLKRLQPLSIQGEANQKGNRKFTLDIIDNNQIIFKPKCREKYTLKLPKLRSNYREHLSYLEQMSKEKKMAYSVKLTSSYISITFEEQSLKTKKIENRVISIDLNPNRIGYSICDYIDDEQKIIEASCVEYKDLNTKLGLSSSDLKQKYQNNKREYEQYQIVKFLINKALHYKCDKFIIEGLSKGLKGNSGKGKGFNRLVNNIWNRDLFKKSLKKHCKIFGIKFIDINPAYSSIIGNTIYKDYPDPICASLEINRRGQFKFQKDKFYPKVPNVDYLNELWKQTLDKSFESWKELLSWLKNSKVKYRIPLDENLESFSLKSNNSKVILYNFSRKDILCI
jgi:IS605 OrfB family transposase